MKFRLLLLLWPVSITALAEERNGANVDKEASKWDGKNIPVCWENPSVANQKYRSWVQDAIKNSWQKEAAVDFTCWCPCTGNSKGIRIKVEDTDQGPYTEGLGKYLDGRKNGMVLQDI